MWGRFPDQFTVAGSRDGDYDMRKREIKSFAVALVVAALLVPPPRAGAQMSEEEAVVRVVRDLFDGMRDKDTTKIQGVFAPGATLGSAGRDSVRYSTAESFVLAIGRSTARLDERVWDWEVRIDGNLAMMWTKYDILIDGEFSHCGVDAFHLHKSSDGWRIFHLADSRRRDPGCWRYPGGS